VFYISESTIPFLPGCTILYFHWFFFWKVNFLLELVSPCFSMSV
jgi:hypothetical protein